jgi:hypothetical protein
MLPPTPYNVVPASTKQAPNKHRKSGSGRRAKFMLQLAIEAIVGVSLCGTQDCGGVPSTLMTRGRGCPRAASAFWKSAEHQSDRESRKARNQSLRLSNQGLYIIGPAPRDAYIGLIRSPRTRAAFEFSDITPSRAGDTVVGHEGRH